MAQRYSEAPGGSLALGVLQLDTALGDASIDEKLGLVVARANIAEQYGFTRFWIAQHYGINDAWGDTTPIVTLVLRETDRMRVGPGAILLRHNPVAHIASSYRCLAAMFDDRVDIAVARAIPSHHDAAKVLSDELSAASFEDRLDRLMSLLGGDSPFIPRKGSMPQLWLVGSGTTTASLAAHNGLRYTHSCLHAESTHHVRGNTGSPERAAAVFVVCAASDEEARVRLRRLKINENQLVIAGDSSSCVKRLRRLAYKANADTLMLVFLDDRIEAFRDQVQLLAKELNNNIPL